MEAGYENFWKDTLKLALSYNPFNISAMYYSIVGSFPPFLRPLFFKLYLPFRAASKLCGRLIVVLLVLANSVPGLNTLKMKVSKKLHYS